MRTVAVFRKISDLSTRRASEVLYKRVALKIPRYLMRQVSALLVRATLVVALLERSNES